MKNTNIKRIVTSKKKVFDYWLQFLKPYHKLRQKEIEAVSLMLYYRYELSREISNIDLVEKLLFSTETRKEMRAELGGMGPKVFNNMLTTLRKKGVLGKDNKINPGLIPKMSETGFKLIFSFEVKDEIKQRS